MVILKTMATLAVITSLLAVRLPAQANTRITKDSAAAVETVHRFHTLLASGDSSGAVQLLAPDLVVLESGSVETRAEYLGHHLGADMRFAKAVPSERRVAAVHQDGDVVWVVETSTSRGEFRDRKIDSRGAELVVLTRSASGWLIRAIHWSSRRSSP